MSSRIGRIARYFGRSGVMHRIANRRSFPGLGIDHDVMLEVGGDFRYGSGCSVGTGANIIVPAQARLVFEDDCYIGRHVELGAGAELRIGADTSIQDRCILLGEISIGRHCVFAPNIYISSARHYFDLQPAWLIRDQDRHVGSSPELAARHHRPVMVEDDCWLGINSVIMPGVTVGKGAIIGAGAVVSHDVAPYTVVAGAPARAIRTRLNFSPPRRLNHANSADLPYFYSGFQVSQAALAGNKLHGGMLTRGGFVLSLDTREARTLHLIVKCEAPADVLLSVGDQQRLVGANFAQVVFDCMTSHGSANVSVECNPPDATLVLQEAWVQ